MIVNLLYDVTNDKLIDRLLFLAKVEKGIKQADNEETVSHMEDSERMAKWLA